jgi:tetratricopeptide (TPR) repeat protein
MGEFVARHPYKATAWAWLGLVDRTVWEQWKGSKFAEGALDEAIDAYEHASKQDPHGVVNIPPLVELLLARGRPDVARRWAKQALERQNLTRLDPLAGLSEEQLKRLRESAEGP